MFELKHLRLFYPNNWQPINRHTILFLHFLNNFQKVKGLENTKLLACHQFQIGPTKPAIWTKCQERSIDLTRTSSWTGQRQRRVRLHALV